MWIRKITLENIKGFVGKENIIDLSENINLLVGHNNAGKSTILNSVLNIQKNSLWSSNITIGESEGTIKIRLVNYSHLSGKAGLPVGHFNEVITKFSANVSDRENILKSGSSPTGIGFKFGNFPDGEPLNPIYPYLSKRKVVRFDESLNLDATNSVTGDFKYLTAKIARLCNVHHPRSKMYQQACEDIIGFTISTTASSNGHKPAYLIDGFSDIPLEMMGEGVPNLLGLIVDLCIAENKIFLIEELENDVHPKALKSLLRLIERKSENNQFIISTHSNIVTKYLGSIEGAKVFKVTMSIDESSKIPTSKVEEIPDEPVERIRLLEELGYESFDFAQWKGWLILEESSAEVIIRDFLIPVFVPELKSKLRTYSAGSLSEIEPKFRDFNNLFVFIHLEQTYKNKAWVIVDSGEKETETIGKLKEIYSQSGWNEDQFLQFNEHDFERYYPAEFQKEFDRINQMEKQAKRKAKKDLLDEVKKWIEENPDEAKTEFSKSAGDVIDKLKMIADKLNN